MSYLEMNHRSEVGYIFIDGKKRSLMRAIRICTVNNDEESFVFSYIALTSDEQYRFLNILETMGVSEFSLAETLVYEHGENEMFEDLCIDKRFTIPHVSEFKNSKPFLMRLEDLFKDMDMDSRKMLKLLLGSKDTLSAIKELL